MFSKTSSTANEIESALIQSLPEDPKSQFTQTLENLDRTAETLEQLGLKEAAEQTTNLLERLAATQVANQREATLYYLQKALESLLKLPERKNPVFHTIIKQTTDLVQRAYLRIEGLNNLAESSSSEYEEEEGPATLRPSGTYEKESTQHSPPAQEVEAGKFWENEIKKNSQEKPVHTIQFPPGAVDGIISDSLQMAGIPYSQYQYSKDGSVVKFTPHQLRRFLKELREFIAYINEPENEEFQEEGKNLQLVLNLVEQKIKEDRGIAQASDFSNQFNKTSAKKKTFDKSKSKKKLNSSKSKFQKIKREVEKLRKLTPEQEVENLKNIGWVFEAPEDCEICQKHQEHMMLAHDHSCEHSRDCSMNDDLRERGGVPVPLMGGEGVAPANPMLADDYNWINADKTFEEEPVEDYESCGECGLDHGYEYEEARKAHKNLQAEKTLEELEREWEEDALGADDRHFSHFMDFGTT